jgi:DNA-directed RNA polymerase specialized sigma24 family protein
MKSPSFVVVPSAGTRARDELDAVRVHPIGTVVVYNQLMGLRRLSNAQADALVATDVSSDAELIVRVGRGDQPAFAELVRRYQGAVYRRCRSTFTDPSAAEDATQEAFLRIQGLRASVVVDDRAQRGRQYRQGPVSDSRRGIADEPSARDHSDGVVDRFWLEGILARLPDGEREAIDLSFRADLSHTQVAAKLGRPLGTVKAHIRRGLLRLAELAEDES